MTIAIQDGRERSIAAWTIVILGLAMVLRHNAAVEWIEIAKNVVFLCIQCVGLMLYFSFRQKRLEFNLEKYIGWGDILFFTAVGFGLPTIEFIVFEITSLLFALLGYGLWRYFKENSREEVPLAGIAALWLIVIVTAKWACPSHDFLLEWIDALI